MYFQDVARLTAGQDMTAARCALAIFLSIAKMHAKYWCDSSLGKQYAFLRGAMWTEEAWTAGQQASIGAMKDDVVLQLFQEKRWSGLQARS